MRILFVVHYFLPRHQAGTEIYTYSLAKEMSKNHDVTILTSEDAHLGPGEHKVTRKEYKGLPVIQINRGEPTDFVKSYRDPKLDKTFGEILDELQPEIVHFQHLYRLSIGFIDEAVKRDILQVMTLADYWTICPSIIMMKPGFVRCTGPEKGIACASCGNAVGEEFAGSIATEMLGSGKTQQHVMQAMHSLKRNLPQPIVDFAKDIKDRAVAANPNSKSIKRLDMLTDRHSDMMKTLAKVNLILAPSRFLRETMVQAGVPKHSISYSGYGFDLDKFPRKQRRKFEPPLKVGYVGTIVPHKGVHILIEAFEKVQGAELEIHGDLTHFPNYVATLKKQAKRKPIKFFGRFDNDRAAEIIGALDLLVVPSLWWENSPLTIHEAFLVGTPVVASRTGGMGELVADPMFLYEPGDTADLAGLIRQFVDRPETLRAFGDRRSEVKSIFENVIELEDIYEIVKSRVEEEKEIEKRRAEAKKAEEEKADKEADEKADEKANEKADEKAEESHEDGSDQQDP